MVLGIKPSRPERDTIATYTYTGRPERDNLLLTCGTGKEPPDVETETDYLRTSGLVLPHST